jgi:hypothetical protein
MDTPTAVQRWQGLYATAAGVAPFDAPPKGAYAGGSAYASTDLSQYPTVVIIFKTASGWFIGSGNMGFPYTTSTTSYAFDHPFWKQVMASATPKAGSKWTGPSFVAFTDADAWDKLLKSIGKGLIKSGMSKEVADKFDEAAKEAKSVEDLSLILNHLFSTYGDTLKYNFMVFTYGNKDHVYVAMDKATKASVDKVLKYCKEREVDLNSVIAPVTAAWVSEAEKRDKIAAQTGAEADEDEDENPYVDGEPQD